MLAAADSTIFERARLARAVIITRDHDFVGLVERHGPPPAVVWVTLGNCTNTALLQTFERRWPAVLSLLADGEALIELG